MSNGEWGSMKRRRLLSLSVLVVALLVGGCGLWVWQAKRQYALNRQLINALIQRDTRQALALVKRGADPNTRKDAPSPPTLPQLFLKLLHRSRPTANNSPTAFHIACGDDDFMPALENNSDVPRPDDVPLVQAMLLHGADMQATSGPHWSAVFVAVMYEHPNTAKVLLAHGANINAQDSEGGTPLMLAVQGGDSGTTRLLLARGANVNVQDRYGNAPLGWAVSCLDADTIHLLLEHGANVAQADKWGTTALHVAARRSQDARVIGMLLAHGANPNVPDARGRTPLMVAQQMHRPLGIIAALRQDAK